MGRTQEKEWNARWNTVQSGSRPEINHGEWKTALNHEKPSRRAPNREQSQLMESVHFLVFLYRN